MVEVFKTSITDPKQAKRVIRKLKKVFPDYKMNFDLEDLDNILRIENSSKKIDSHLFIKLIGDFGFSIVILEDRLDT